MERSRAEDGDSMVRLPKSIKAWSVALICVLGAALLLWRVSDKYPVSDWLFWDLAKLVGLTVVLNVSCLGFGGWLLRRGLGIRSLPPLEALLFSMTLGLVAVALLTYVGGALGLLGAAFASIVAISGCGLAYLGRADLGRALKRHVNQRPQLPWWWWGALAWGGFNLAMMYLQVMTPGSINYDAAWYHLTIAQDYAREGGLVPFYGDYNRTYPQLASIIHTWGFSVPGLSPQLRWVLALHVEFSIVLWKIVGVVAAVRWLLGVRTANWAWPVFFVFPAIGIYDQNIGGSADHFLGLFAVPAFLATARALPRMTLRYCTLAAVCLGGAMLTKYQAVYLVVACAVVFAVRWLQLMYVELRGHGLASRRRLLLAAAIVPGVALAVSSPHFIKNAVFYANPIFPFAQDAFPTFPFHERTVFLFEHAFPDRGYLPKADGLRRVWDAVVLFFSYSFEPHYSFNRDYLSAGSLFTLLLPCIPFVPRTRRIWLAVAVSFVAFLVWGCTYLVDRYLQAFVTLPIAVAAAMLYRIAGMGRIPQAALGVLIGVQVIWGADAWFYSGHGRIAAAVNLIRSGYEGRREVEQRFSDRATHLQITEATDPQALILVRNYRTTLGIDRRLLIDVQSFQSYVWYDPLRSVSELYDLYRSRGITHLLYPVGQRPPSTAQAAVLFADLVALQAAEHRQRFGGLELVTLDSPPPPSSGPYSVLVVAMPGYVDGQYSVEQLSVNLRVPAELRRRPQPAAQLTPQQLADGGAIGGVRAALIGKRATIPPTLNQALHQHFVAAEKYRDFTVYLRRDRARR